jgi:hypothetical protein
MMTNDISQKIKRLERERKTVHKMILMYCNGVNGSPKGQLCPDCQSLYAYASNRIDRCPFGLGKPTCARCPVHCYKAKMREQIREVMRYAGPRMLFHHPYLTLMHGIDSLRRMK